MNFNFWRPHATKIEIYTK